MDEKEKNPDLFDTLKDIANTTGMWQEVSDTILKTSLELVHRKDIIQKYYIEDIMIRRNEKVLVKWSKRLQPLSEEEYNKKYLSK